MAKNKVIAGDYLNYMVSQSFGNPYIAFGSMETIALNKDTVEQYEVLDESKTKSALDIAILGLIGLFLLGPVGMIAGMIAGALTSKSKGTYIIAI